jgi:hypothetical protein
MLIRIQVNAVYLAGRCHGAGIEKVTVERSCDFSISLGQTDALGLPTPKFWRKRPLGILE